MTRKNNLRNPVYLLLRNLTIQMQSTTVIVCCWLFIAQVGYNNKTREERSKTDKKQKLYSANVKLRSQSSFVTDKI